MRVDAAAADGVIQQARDFVHRDARGRVLWRGCVARGCEEHGNAGQLLAYLFLQPVLEPCGAEPLDAQVDDWKAGLGRKPVGVRGRRAAGLFMGGKVARCAIGVCAMPDATARTAGVQVGRAPFGADPGH